MDRVYALVTALSSAILLFFAHVFAPWADNLFSGADAWGVPVWLVCGALGLGLVAVTVDLARRPKRAARAASVTG